MSRFYESYFREHTSISPDGKYCYMDDCEFDDQKRVRVCRKFVKAWNDSYAYEPYNEMPKELRLKPSMAGQLERDIKARLREEGMTVEKVIRSEEDGTYLCYEMRIWVKW